jgi:hypothetical protein
MYQSVVPGAANIEAEAFGFARTERIGDHGPYRVAYVTTAAR